MKWVWRKLSVPLLSLKISRIALVDLNRLGYLEWNEQGRVQKAGLFHFSQMTFNYTDSDDDASIPMIFRATERGDLETIKRLIAEDPKVVHETLDTDDQPLHIACWQKFAAIVKVLIEAGADVNGRGDFGNTPLHYAVFEGDEYSMPIVKALLNAGADPNIVDKRSSSTPLKWAMREHHPGLNDSIKLLKSRIETA